MPRISFSGILPIAERVYHASLFIYPEEHRREYGPLMVQVFRDLCRDMYQRRGMLGLVKLWSHVLLDTTVTAVAEHAYELKIGGQLMTKKQRYLVFVSTGFPLALGLILFLVNPRFMRRMVMPTYSAAQPAGWIMTAAIFILVSMAYIVQRKMFVLSNEPDPSRRILCRPVWQRAIFFGSMLLFVLPATALVLFGPAISALLDAGYLTPLF